MRNPKELPKGALERLAMDLKQAKTKAQFQSVQCLWLRASLKLSADQVAIAIGWLQFGAQTASQILQRR